MKKALSVSLLAVVAVLAWLLASEFRWFDGGDGSVASPPPQVGKEPEIGAEPRARLRGRQGTSLAAEEPSRQCWLQVEVRLRGTEEPLEGIRVRGSWSREFMKSTPEVDGEQIAASDAKGRVRLGPLPPGSLHLVARAEDCVAELQSVFLASDARQEEDPTLILWVRGTQSFEGWAQHPDGSPAEGFVVSAFPCASGKRQFESGYTRTASDGSFRFQGLDPDDEFLVRARSFGRVKGEALEGWALARPGRGSVHIVLRGSDTASTALPLSVRVEDPQGRPVPTFKVKLRGDMAEGAKCIQESGWFHCDAVEGRCWLSVWGAGSADGTPLPLGPVLAGPFESGGSDYTVVLPHEESYAGRVVDAHRNGVAGVTLTAFPWSADEDLPKKNEALSSGESADDGSFRLGRLPRGKVRVFIEPPEGYAHLDSCEAVCGADQVAVVLAQAVTATLRIVSEDDEPLSGVGVTICVPDRGWEFRVSHVPLPGLVTGDLTEDDGVVTLACLDPSRTYILRVNAFRFLRWDVLSHVDKKWRPADGVIRLPRAYSISGRVQNQHGEAVVHAPVRISCREGGYWQSVTGDDGVFEIGRLPAGEYTIDAWPPRRDTRAPPTASVLARAGTSNVKVTLPVAAATAEGGEAGR